MPGHRVVCETTQTPNISILINANDSSFLLPCFLEVGIVRRFAKKGGKEIGRMKTRQERRS